MATAAKRPPSKKGEQKAKLDALGIDKIVEMILEDKSYAVISAELEMGTRTLVDWLEADSTRSARAKEARVKSAAACDDLALQALMAIDDDAPPGMIARQREIASHYRWRAKSRNPREYGDKVQVDADIKVETIDQVDRQIDRLIAKLGLIGS